jgi:hypothetical protein
MSITSRFACGEETHSAAENIPTFVFSGLAAPRLDPFLADFRGRPQLIMRLRPALQQPMWILLRSGQVKDLMT